MYPRLYAFDKFWDIPRRQEGRQLDGVALGVAQYVVGTFELEMKRRAATVKAYVDNEPFWLNMEAFKAARVLLEEVPSCKGSFVPGSGSSTFGNIDALTGAFADRPAEGKSPR